MEVMKAAVDSAFLPLRESLGKLVPPELMKDQLSAPKQLTAPDRVTAAWAGGALFSQLSTFAHSAKVSRSTYDEVGPAGVLSRFNTERL
jgi:actin-related protein